MPESTNRAVATIPRSQMNRMPENRCSIQNICGIWNWLDRMWWRWRMRFGLPWRCARRLTFLQLLYLILILSEQLLLLLLIEVCSEEPLLCQWCEIRKLPRIQAEKASSWWTLEASQQRWIEGNRRPPPLWSYFHTIVKAHGLAEVSWFWPQAEWHGDAWPLKWEGKIQILDENK